MVKAALIFGVFPAIPLTALTLNPPAPVNINVGTSVTFTVSASSSSWNMSGGGSWISGPGPMSGTYNFTSAGTYSLTVSGSNGVATCAPINVSKLNQAAVSVSASPTSVIAGGTSAISPSGGSGTGAFNYSIQSGPGSISGSTVTATGGGTIVVAVYKAGDATYAQSNTATVSIAAASAISPVLSSYNFAVNSPPTISTTQQGLQSQFRLRAKFEPGDFQAANSWNQNPVTLDTLPAPGTYSVYLYWVQYNAAGNAVLQIGPMNLVSVTVNPISTTFTVSPTSFTYTGSAQGPGITPNPSGASYSTGGTPSAAAAGNYSVTATATGNYTGTSGAVGWTINKASQPTPGISASPTSINVGGTSAISASGGAGTGALTYSIQSGPGTISGTTVTATGGGTIVAAVYRAGDANYNQSPTATVSITVNSPVTFTISPTSFTYNGGSQGPTITPSPGGATYSTSGTPSATAAGNYSVTATANGSYTGTSGAVGWTINTAAQPMPSIGASPTSINVGGTSAISASGGAGTGAFNYSIQSGPGTISGTTVTATGTGTIVAAVYRSGDSNYNQSPTATVSIAVGLATQPTVTASASPTSINVGSTSAISASGGAGTGAFNYSIQSGPGTISGTTVTATGAGTIVVAVYKAGDSTYAQSNTATASISVSLATQPTVTASASPAAIIVGGTSSITASGGAGTGAFNYSIQSGPGTISGTTVTATGAGTIGVAVYKAGDSTYAQSNTATASISVAATSLVVLSSYSFPASSSPLPTISTAQSNLQSQYRLRAKFNDGSSGGFHAATAYNNNGLSLDVLPTPASYPATYPVALYWVQYDSTGTTVLQIGPANNVSVTITAPSGGGTLPLTVLRPAQ